MTQNTLTYVEGVVRCEDLEAMLFAAAALMQLRDAPVEFDEEAVNQYHPYYLDYSDDYDQEYEDWLDYMDYVQQSYD